VPSKRYLPAVAVLALLAGLSGCGDDDNGDSASSGDKSHSITFVQGVKGDEFYVSMACGAQEEAKKVGAQLEVTGPEKWDVAQQTSVVNSVAAKKPDAVLVAPVDVEAMRGPLQQLKTNGSKIVEVDTKLNDDSLRESTIASNNEEGGTLAAKTLAELIGDKGKVLLINVKPGISTTDARAKGFETELKNHPNIQYLGVQYNNDDPNKAAAIVTSTLAAHPDLAGIFAANVFTGEGAATGLQQAKKQGAVKLVAFDATPKQVEALEAGAIQALIAQKPYEIGVQGVQQAVAALEGKSVQKEISTDLVAVTKENMNQPDVNKYLYKGAC
jgi:ribose transport system substrate-binding protein